MAGSPTSHPIINAQLLPAAIVDSFDDRRDMIYGQLGPSATATSGELQPDIHVATKAEIAGLFGIGDLYWRVLRWRDGVQISDGGLVPPLDVIGITPAGTAATTVITVTTDATEAGSFNVSLVDEDEFTVTIDVITGDTPTIIGGKIVTAVNALPDKIFTAANAVGVVTITATDVGAIGNDYGVKISKVKLTGTSVALTSGWTGGAGTPTLTGILDAIDGIRYTGLNWPEEWPLNDILSEFDARFNVANNIMDGMVLQGSNDTFANNKLKVSTLETQVYVGVGNNVTEGTLQKGPAILTPAGWAASYFMAVRDKRMTTGALIGDLIVATNARDDAIGGPGLASLPYFNTPLPEVPVTPVLNLYNSTEQLELEADGITTYGNSNNRMVMGPAVTPWTTDAAGNPNISFHYLNYVDTGSVCREIFFRTLKSVFSQTRLTEGDIVEGRSMTNAAGIMAELLSIYRILSTLSLTQAGSEAELYFKNNTVVTIDLASRSATIYGPLPIVTQLGTINYALALSFSVGQQSTQITV